MKKIGFQKKLHKSCIAYRIRIFFLHWEFDSYIKKLPSPIQMYKKLQTIGNMIPGGENGGLFSDSKISLASGVSNEERIPIPRGSIIQRISIKIRNAFLFILFCLILSLLNFRFLAVRQIHASSPHLSEYNRSSFRH